MEIILIAFIFAALSAFVAHGKGRNVHTGFWLGFWLGPFGLIMALCATARDDVLMHREFQHKYCPRCAERIQARAVCCRWCGAVQRA